MNNQDKLNRLNNPDFIKKHNLIKEDIDKIIKKYDVYAYDMVISALLNPKQLKDKNGTNFCYSNQAIHYFANHDLSDDEIAKITNSPASEIKDNHPIPKTNAPYTPISSAPVSFQTPTPNELVKQMTIDDYRMYCKPEDKPAPTYQALEEAAWNDFGKGEGLIEDLYLDHLGHATIGNGHLVLHKDHLYDKKKLAAYKKSYIELPLINKKGKALSTEEKENQFEVLLNNMRQRTLKRKRIPYAGSRIIFPEFGQLNEAGMRQVFNDDFKFHYSRIKYDPYNKRVMFPNFEHFLLPVQLEILHTLYAGQISALYKRTTGHNNNLALIHQAVSDTRMPIASYGEKQTIKKAGLSLRHAEQSYVVIALRKYKENSQDLAMKQSQVRHIAISDINKTHIL
jgi:hypothetical protein